MPHLQIQKYLITKKLIVFGKEGLKTFAKIWAESDELDNYKVSPINGDFNNLGHITLSVGTHELLYPDVIKLSRKFKL